MGDHVDTDAAGRRDGGGEAAGAIGEQAADAARCFWESADLSAAPAQEEQEEKGGQQEASLMAEVDRLKGEKSEALLPALKTAQEQQPEQQEEALQNEYVSGVLREAEDLREVYPDLELQEEMMNPLFASLLAGGYPLERVVAFFHPEWEKARLLRQAEREVVGRIRKRQMRPSPIRAANRGSVSGDLSKMSDDQVMAIDRRIRRGERVVL